MRFFRKMTNKGQNISKFGQKCTKCENILKKSSLMRSSIGCMKQLEICAALYKEQWKKTNISKKNLNSN